MRKTALLLLAAAAGFFLWSTYVVIKARREVPALVEKALKSPQATLELEDLTARQIEILLKVEDPNFFNHEGIDLKTPGAGLTTITQGLVKILFFKRYRPALVNKIKQSLIARFALDPLVDKRTQLKLFVNYVYLGRAGGRPVYGFAQAAKAYFGKEFSQLTEDEYISLVAMIIAPSKFHVKRNPQANRDRAERIKRLIEGKYKPKGLMDLYYGGKKPGKGIKGWIERILWGY